MKSFLFLLFIFLPLVSWGWCDEEFSFQGGGWSKHIISSERREEEPWNESHGMIGVSCDSWRIMNFTNSWEEETWSFTYETQGKDYLNDRLHVSWVIGGWSGYEEVVGGPGILPIIVPKLEYRLTERVSFESLLAGVVYTASFKITLGEIKPRYKFARP